MFAFKRYSGVIGLCLAVILAQPQLAEAQEAASGSISQAIDLELEQRQDALAALYMDLHAHPEVAFQEERTAQVLSERMRAVGFEVTDGVGRTGLVAVYRNGEGPTVLIRTDMDALPMEEKTGLSYASTVRQIVDGEESSIMHACGHDLHMTWWIGAAETLMAMQDGWSGTLVFIAQPAEEVLQGARAMLDDGLFTRFPRPDYAFGAHVSNAPAGQVTIKEGATASASDAYEIIFHGRGGHGSMPSSTIDPIVMASHFVTDVQSVVAREKPEGEFGIISIGSFQSGTVANIIPDHATLRLTLRSFSAEVRELLNDGVIRTARGSAIMAGAPEPEIIHINGAEVLINDRELARATNNFLTPALGETLDFIPAHMPGIPPSEDFSEYVAEGVPGLFFQIGGYSPAVIAAYRERGETLPANHSPYFAPDPDLAIAPGVKTLAMAVFGVLGRSNENELLN